MKSMYMDSEKLKTIAEKFKKKIEELEECFSAINDKVKELDGSSETWKGEKQRKFYNSYTLLANDFPTNIEKFNEFYEFLCNTIREYEKKDSSINKDVDVNVDNLDM